MAEKISRRNFEIKAKESKMIKKGLIVGIMLMASVSFSQDWKKHSVVIADFENKEVYKMRGWNSKGASHSVVFSTEQVKNGKKSLKLDYTFNPEIPGVKYWTHSWSNREIDPILSSAFKEGVKTLGIGMWIYGDNSGNTFLVRMGDKYGETWNVFWKIDWEGWKFVETEIKKGKKGISYYGGKKGYRGVVDYPLRLLCIEFDFKGGSIKGTIYIDDITLFTDKEVETKIMIFK